MRLVHFGTVGALTALLLVSTLCGPRDFSTTLDDDSLASIRGLSLTNKTETASDACEDATTAGTDAVPEYLCPLAMDGTVCVSCTCGSQVTAIQNTTGGPGIQSKSTLIACNNCTGKLGLCGEGMCFTMANDNCTGSPRVYQNQ